MSVISQLRLTSPAFADGSAIPRHHTCDGDDVSPALSWEPGPGGTRAWVLIVEDPTASNWVHWLVVNLPGETTSLDENASGNLPGEAVEGQNDFGSARYGGPCPPSGVHEYVFSLYALSEPVEVGAEITAPAIRRAISGNILAEGQLKGTYQRG